MSYDLVKLRDQKTGKLAVGVVISKGEEKSTVLTTDNKTIDALTDSIKVMRPPAHGYELKLSDGSMASVGDYVKLKDKAEVAGTVVCVATAYIYIKLLTGPSVSKVCVRPSACCESERPPTASKSSVAHIFERTGPSDGDRAHIDENLVKKMPPPSR